MQFEVGSVLEGKVVSVTKFGAFVEIGEGKTGMVHISEVSNTYVTDINEHVKSGQEVKVKVLSVAEDGKISLSMKRAMPEEERPRTRRTGAVYVDYSGSSKKKEPMSFEDMLSKFKQSSDEKMSDLKKSIGAKQRGGYSRRGSSRSI